MDAHLFTHEPPPDALEAARLVYQAAFAQPPYREGPDQAAAFVERVHRYAAHRDGLRLVVTQDGQPAGMGLAVLARPGDFWRDRAAESVASELADRWMGGLCLEVVHLAVHPRVQRRGVGRLVHDVLIAGTPAPVGMLACNPLAEPARRLYAGRGWRVLTDRMPAGDDTTVLLMARDL